MYNLLIVVHILISIILVGAVLIQSGRGASTANIFGGARAAENVFGASTPAILNKVTAALATAFIVSSIALTIMAGERRRPIIDRMIRDQRSQPAGVIDRREAERPAPEPVAEPPEASPAPPAPELPTESVPGD